nr:MAG TPA: hypothetical protein [Caudoviricetes sp.]
MLLCIFFSFILKTYACFVFFHYLCGEKIIDMSEPLILASFC